MNSVSCKKIFLSYGRRNGHKWQFSKHGILATCMCYSTLNHLWFTLIISRYFFKFRLMEEAYVMKDPFSEERGFITLGSSCNICRAKVCLSQVLKIMLYKRNCSLFLVSSTIMMISDFCYII